MPNSERENWSSLPEIYVRLVKDELGYPPRDWEQLKAEELPGGTVYRLKSIPFYARGLAYGDEIRVKKSEEGFYPVLDSVSKRSGYSTMRLSVSDTEDRNALIEYFTGKGCLLEFDGNLVAVAIPSDCFDDVSDFICDQKDANRWDAEDGFLITDDPVSNDLK